jgi:hypothetical protein
MTGSYNYSQRCWRFDPRKRVFARDKDLDWAVFAELDAATKTLTSRFRAVGRTYGTIGYAWEKGKLVTTLEEYVTHGEREDGKPLPAGYDRWVRRKERRGGRLVKVFEGPAKDPPQP